MKAERNKRRRENRQETRRVDTMELEDRNLYEDIAEHAKVSKGPRGLYFPVASSWDGTTSKGQQMPYVTGFGVRAEHIRYMFNKIGHEFGQDWRDHVHHYDVGRTESGRRRLDAGLDENAEFTE